jgi:pantetheine-phosphate adenylyltransferase
VKRAVYPGSFDPVTNGHLDIIERASLLFDELIVAVAYNDEKNPLFTSSQRIELLGEVVGHLPNVKVAEFEGLLIDFAREQGATAIVRGLRAISDFEFEFQMALMNRKLNPELETVFMMPKEEYTYLSSRIVKEIARLGGNVGAFVPHSIAAALKERFTPRS